MELTKTKKFNLILGLSASIALSGCQGLGGGVFGGGTDADPRLNSGHQAEFFGESGMWACVGGGLIGAASGAIIGASTGDSSTAAAGAAIGAVAGCGVGMGTNYYLEKQRTSYANKEDRLNAEIQQVQSANQASRETIAAARTVLAQDNQNLAKLDKQIKNKTVQQSQARQELAKIDANLKTLNERLAKLKSSRENFTASSRELKSQGANVSQYNAQIAQLNKQINELESLVAATSKQRTAIRLG